MERLVVEAFGVSVAVSAPAGFDLEPLMSGLPPDYERRPDHAPAGQSVEVVADGAGFRVRPDTQPPHAPFDRALTLRVAQSTLEVVVAQHAPGLVFVHAGAVAVDGRALLLPGRSMAGKSTLTMALVGAGARYLSDEFAVVDPTGAVLPYARPVALRHGGRRQLQVSEGAVQRSPARVGLVADLRYDAGTGWQVARMTPGESTLALLGQAAPATARPAETLDALTAACAGVSGLRGTRGDAGEAAERLLRALRKAA